MASPNVLTLERTNFVISRVYATAMLSRARIHNIFDGSFSVFSEWSQTDAVRKEKLTFEQNHTLSLSDSGVLQLQHSSIPSITSLGRGFPFVLESGVRSVWDLNNSTGIRAICCEYRLPSVAQNANKATLANCPEAGSFVHLWNDGVLWKTIKLPSDGCDAKHGKVISNTGTVLSGAHWSWDNKRIVYLAESSQSNDMKDSKTSDFDNSAFLYRDNWGELLQDVYKPTVCILDIDSESVETAPFKENALDVAASDPVWCPGNDGIVFVGYDLNAYNLGLTYCTQRQSSIYFWDLKSQKINCITNSVQAVRCPRFSPDGSRLIWLEQQVGGPHRRCDTLKSVTWPLDGSLIMTVVPEIRWPNSSEEFPGLFCDLPERCWTTDGKFVIVSSIWGFTLATLLISMTDQKHDSDSPPQILRLPNPFKIKSVPDSPVQDFAYTSNVLDVNGNIVIASASSPCHSPCLAVFAVNNLNDSDIQADLQERAWLIICGGSTADQPKLLSLKNVEWSVSVHQIEVDQTHPNVHCFESLLVSPKFDDSDGIQPVEFADFIPTTNLLNQNNLANPYNLKALVVIPHGGPHSNITASWSPITAGFLLSGFSCLFINYRGSLGYGQDFVDSLPGYIGEADVADCVQATRVALQNLQKYAPELPVVLFGGSHGGFLSLHLAARYPELYRAAVTRNPVTHLVSMIDTSDIPDWCYTETGIYGTRDWPLGHLPSEQDLNRLSQASPIFYLNSDWKTPLLLCLGGKDCRVPMSQGLTFYKKIKALCKDVPCKVLVYPHDSHPLESPSTSIDVLNNTICWFRKHLNLS